MHETTTQLLGHRPSNELRCATSMDSYGLDINTSYIMRHIHNPRPFVKAPKDFNHIPLRTRLSEKPGALAICGSSCAPGQALGPASCMRSTGPLARSAGHNSFQGGIRQAGLSCKKRVRAKNAQKRVTNDCSRSRSVPDPLHVQPYRFLNCDFGCHNINASLGYKRAFRAGFKVFTEAAELDVSQPGWTSYSRDTLTLIRKAQCVVWCVMVTDPTQHRRWDAEAEINRSALERQCFLSQKHHQPETPGVFSLAGKHCDVHLSSFLVRSRPSCVSVNSTHQIHVLKQCQHVWHHFTGEGRWSNQIHETRDVLDRGCPYFCFVVLKKAGEGYHKKQHAKRKVSASAQHSGYTARGRCRHLRPFVSVCSEF